MGELRSGFETGLISVCDQSLINRDGIARTLAVRFSANTALIFIDGVKVAESVLTVLSNYSGYWRLGHSRAAIAEFAIGIRMQGSAIFNTALSDVQIAAIQNFV